MSDALQPWIGLLMALAFALPCFGMGARMLHVWRQPLDIENGRWVQLGVGVMVMEFILLHAGVFLAGLAVGVEGLGLTLLAAFGLAAFYALFALAISHAFKSRMLLESFLWMIGGRLLALLIGISTREANLILAYSVLSAVLYLPLVFASVFLPVPRLGITAEIAASMRLPDAGGLWVEQPHRAIGVGTVYFFSLGVLSLLVLGGMALS
ncbi:MAG TPA: hypothetical protein PKZ76_02500 [Xanthomonadaceae bacterium]|nr:hypothetical protein [Xanthomonadaceae bacterium]